MPRFRFVLTLLIVGVTCMVATLANERPQPIPQPQNRTQLWFDEQRIDRDQMAAMGFTIVAEQRGLVLMEHDSGHCYLAPALTAPYIETDPDLCANVRTRQTEARSIDEFGMMVPR